MPVIALVNAAFNESFARHEALHRRWTAAGISVGARAPASLMMMMSVQRLGTMDILLRSMETEILGCNIDFGFEWLAMLSESWICDAYNILRSLKQRRRIDLDPPRDELFADISAVRVAIDKHQIARDRRLSEPLQMESRGLGAPPRMSVYDPDDVDRSHIQPRSMSTRGSLIWHVIHVGPPLQQRAVERLSVSVDILDLFESHLR